MSYRTLSKNTGTRPVNTDPATPPSPAMAPAWVPNLEWWHRAKLSSMEKERDAGRHTLALLESKLSVMNHERDVLTKLKTQAEGSTHHQVGARRIRGGSGLITGQWRLRRRLQAPASQTERYFLLANLG